MADSVTSQVLVNGARNLVAKFTNESDGTGETGVKKLDATSATYAVNGQPPGIHWAVWYIEYDIKSMGLRILWDATSATDMLVLGGFGTQDYKRFGGLYTPAVTGATGSILFTTVSAAIGSSYTVIFHMKKNVPTS